jgi:hypothetical protein
VTIPASVAGSDAELRGHVHEVRNRLCPHLSDHATSVCLHRNLADVELGTDLLVQEAGDDQRHDFPFTLGE